MKRLIGWLIAGALAVAAPAAFAQGKKGTDAKSTDTKKTAAPSGASDQEIADAKAKGMVWVNLDSKVYHKEGRYYGHTKQGKFMTEADAQKAGYRAAKESGVGKKATDKGTDKKTDSKKK